MTLNFHCEVSLSTSSTAIFDFRRKTYKQIYTWTHCDL